MFPYVWLNGRILLRASAWVPAASEGFRYGIGAFETFRWYCKGGIFRLADHQKRMNAALQFLGLQAESAWKSFREALEAILTVHRVRSDAVLRWTVAAGTEGELIRLLEMRPVPYPPAAYEQGVVATTVAVRRGTLARFKTLCYADLWQALRHARANGAQEALLVEDDCLLEGATSNLFLWIQNRLRTPPCDGRILPGVTRAAVLELARSLGWTVEEEPIHRTDLACADEAFLTNSVAEILPLVRLGDRPIGDGRPGARTRRLHRAYQEMVRCERNGNPFAWS